MSAGESWVTFKFRRDFPSAINHTQTQHKCVLDSCRVLQDEGFDVTYLPVKSNGLIDMAELRHGIRALAESSPMSMPGLQH
jgi:cysteine sulfinate desulfinase/cysteine desulfurase-like protein